MHAQDLDDLHAKYSTGEILAEVKRRFCLPEDTSVEEVFKQARQKYYQTSCGESAVPDYQHFLCRRRRKTYRFPLYLGSWVMKEKTESA